VARYEPLESLESVFENLARRAKRVPTQRNGGFTRGSRVLCRAAGTAAPPAARQELEWRRSSRCGLVAYAPPISSQAAGAGTQLNGAYMDLGSLRQASLARPDGECRKRARHLFRRLESKPVDRPLVRSITCSHVARLRQVLREFALAALARARARASRLIDPDNARDVCLSADAITSDTDTDTDGRNVDEETSRRRDNTTHADR